VVNVDFSTSDNTDDDKLVPELKTNLISELFRDREYIFTNSLKSSINVKINIYLELITVKKLIDNWHQLQKQLFLKVHINFVLKNLQTNL
jgi:hypothetical protein